MKPETIEKLKKLAQRATSITEEDFNAYDSSGGNYDDAWAYGMDDGETLLAQKILEAEVIEKYFNSYNGHFPEY